MLSQRFGEHVQLLTAAQNVTDDIFLTLMEAASSAETVKTSFLMHGEWVEWWPYVICPVASLVMGSYGLPPSIVRNLVLIVVGSLRGIFGCNLKADRYLRGTCRPLYLKHG